MIEYMHDSFKEKLKEKAAKDISKHFKKTFSFGAAPESDICSSVIKEEKVSQEEDYNEEEEEEVVEETDGDEHDITLLTSQERAVYVVLKELKSVSKYVEAARIKELEE